MFINLLYHFIISINVAIDIGSHFTKSFSFVNSEFPQINLNMEAKRITPSYIALRSKNGTIIDDLKLENCNNIKVSIGDRALSWIENKPHLGWGNFIDYVGYNKSIIEKYRKNFFFMNEIKGF